MDQGVLTKKHLYLILASSAAIVFEWYDFSIFVFYAVIFSKLFFPFGDDATSLLTTFIVFAVSFLFRPVGSFLYANIGDRYGRKKAFVLSVILMGIPTVGIGLLPDYQQIGITATVLLIILRIIQGISIGGERSTTVSFLVEHAPANHRGFFGSFSLFSTAFGIVLASAVTGFTATILNEKELIDWGWRIPFLVGGLTGFIAFYLRRNVEESESFVKLQKSRKISKKPLAEAISNYWKEILTVLGATIVMAVGFYMIFVYLVTFAVTSGKMELSSALNINTLNMAAMSIMMPLMGLLSDRIGRKPVLITGCVGMIAVSYYLFYIFYGSSFYLKILIQFTAGTFNAMIGGALAAFIVESFPTRVRMSGISLGHVVSFAVFGGTVPMVATYLVETTSIPTSPGIYLMICSFISLIVYIKMNETYRKELD